MNRRRPRQQGQRTHRAAAAAAAASVAAVLRCVCAAAVLIAAGPLPGRAQSASEVAAAASGASVSAGRGGPLPRLVRTEPPRDAARHIGDVVVDRVLVDLPPGWAIDRDGVSGEGLEGRPIELRSHTLAAADDPGCAGCRWLDLRWQIFKGLRDAEDLRTPPTALRLRRGDRIAVLTIPSVVLAVSPLVNWDLRPGWLDSMRPGWKARPFDVQARVDEAGLALAVAASAGIGWLWSSGRWLPRRGARPFAEALRQLRARRRRDRGLPPTADADDLRIWHRAFDASAGEAVFGETLDAFFGARPAFSPLAGAVRTVFAASREAFFFSADPARGSRIARQDLLDLTQQLVRAEFASGRGRRA